MKTDGAAIARRIYILMCVLTTSGLAGAWFLGGWHAAGGFATGSAVAFGNAWWMSRLSLPIGVEENASYGGLGVQLLAVGRYLLMAGILYVILKVSEIGFLAALAGCFVHIVAVVLEVVYELTYGTS